MHRKEPLMTQVRKGCLVALVAGMIALVGRADSVADLYQWVDKQGKVHYSNAPSDVSTSKEVTRIPTQERRRPSGQSQRPVGTEADSEDEDEDELQLPWSHGNRASRPAGASLERSALRRELKQATATMAEIDRKLDVLSEARMRHAKQGHPSVGGLRAIGAVDVRSEEEEALEKRRQEVAKRIDEIRARIAELGTRR